MSHLDVSLCFLCFSWWVSRSNSSRLPSRYHSRGRLQLSGINIFQLSWWVWTNWVVDIDLYKAWQMEWLFSHLWRYRGHNSNVTFEYICRFQSKEINSTFNVQFFFILKTQLDIHKLLKNKWHHSWLMFQIAVFFVSFRDNLSSTLPTAKWWYAALWKRYCGVFVSGGLPINRWK